MGVLEGLFSPYLTADNLTALGRMGLATLLGMLLGIDREVRHKPAGLRSHMLVSLAAALLTILTFRIADAADQLGGAVRADPLRIMEAVVAGIAFLGAGAIIRGRDKVRGVTTGASLWLAGALGVACGSGSYGLAIVAALIGLFVLFVLGWIEHAVTTADTARADADGRADDRAGKDAVER